MNMLSYSKEESETFGLNIARSNCIERLFFQQLSQEIFENKYDLCRVKISMSSNEIFNEINKTGIPYNLFSFLVRKSTSTPGTIEYKIPALRFTRYTNQHETDFVSVLNNVIRNSSGINYSNNLYQHLIDKDKMTEASIRYYLSLATYDQNAYFYLGYLNEKCAGFCSFRLENNIAEGIYFGVSTEYRNLGLAHEFLTYAKESCFKLGASQFITDTIIQNPNSLYPQMNIGLIPKETFANVVFFPFLSKKPDFNKIIYIDNYFSIFNTINDWLKEIGLINVKFDEIKTIHQYEETSLRDHLNFRLHVFDNSLIIISVTSENKLFCIYFTGTIIS